MPVSPCHACRRHIASVVALVAVAAASTASIAASTLPPGYSTRQLTYKDMLEWEDLERERRSIT